MHMHIGELVVGFLFVLAKRLEIGVFEAVGQFRPDFHVEGDVIHQPFFSSLRRTRSFSRCNGPRDCQLAYSVQIFTQCRNLTV